MHKVDIRTRLSETDDWLDFSTLSLFMRCPRQYFWRVRKSIDKAESPALQFGSAIHAALALWHKNKNDDEAYKEFIKEVACITIEDPKRNASVGLSVLNDYFERWRIESYETIETEIGFAFDVAYHNIIEGKPKSFIFIGKIDRYINGPMGKMVFETKTTTIAGERWMLRGKPNLQIDGYVSAIATLTGECPAGGVLDIIHIHEDPKKRKPIGRIITMRSAEDVDKWSKNVSEWFTQIKLCDSSNFYPMNTETCVPLMGFTCGYIELCNMYPNPPQEDILLPDSFSIKKWHPYESVVNEGVKNG